MRKDGAGSVRVRTHHCSQLRLHLSWPYPLLQVRFPHSCPSPDERLHPSTLQDSLGSQIRVLLRIRKALRPSCRGSHAGLAGLHSS